MTDTSKPKIVKPLEWAANGSGEWSCFEIGHGFSAYYDIDPCDHGLASVAFGVICHEFGETEIWKGPKEQAKAAAQADHEQRILAALNPDFLTRAETAEARLAEATAQIHRLTAVGDGLSAFVCDEGDPDVKRWRKACDEAFRTIFRKDQGRDQ